MKELLTVFWEVRFRIKLLLIITVLIMLLADTLGVVGNRVVNRARRLHYNTRDWLEKVATDEANR